MQWIHISAPPRKTFKSFHEFWTSTLKCGRVETLTLCDCILDRKSLAMATNPSDLSPSTATFSLAVSQTVCLPVPVEAPKRFGLNL